MLFFSNVGTGNYMNTYCNISFIKEFTFSMLTLCQINFIKNNVAFVHNTKITSMKR